MIKLTKKEQTADRLMLGKQPRENFRRLTCAAGYVAIRTHLLRQGRRAAVAPEMPLLNCMMGLESEICEYRTRGGLRCAIGCLIPRRLYRAELEGHGVDSHLVRAVLPIWDDPWRANEMLHAAQWVHDQIAPHRWAFALDLERERGNMGPAC